MKKIQLFLIFFILISVMACEKSDEKNNENRKTNTQNSEEEQNTENTDLERKINSKCTFIGNSSEKINNTFPFNKTTRIEAIHFKPKNAFDSYKSFAEIINHKLILPDVVSRYDLSEQQIEKLFEIFYQYKGKDVDGAKCYEPEHIFVFYEQDKAIAFFEICFDCRGTREKNIKVEDLCDEKWSMLYNNFFNDMNNKNQATKDNYKGRKFDLEKFTNYEKLEKIKIKSEVYQKLFGDNIKSNPNPLIIEKLFSKEDRKNGLKEYTILTGGDTIYATILAYLIYDKNDNLITAFELARSGGDAGYSVTTKGYFENDTTYHRTKIKTVPKAKDGGMDLEKIISDTIKETFILSKKGILKKIK